MVEGTLFVVGPLKWLLGSGFDEGSRDGGIAMNKSARKAGEAQEASKGPSGLGSKPLTDGVDLGRNWGDLPVRDNMVEIFYLQLSKGAFG